jgi:hypothetical protein
VNPPPKNANAGKQRLRLSLAAWRRLRRRPDLENVRLSLSARLGYWMGGASHSLLARIQQTSFAEKIRTAAPAPPLFLLGFWRSGTTFLHELFCCDPRFGFASTYACLNPAHFLLTEQWMRRRPIKTALRPMDSMKYSWASPQEDEFALLNLDAPSPYEALIFPSLMQDPRSLLDLRYRPPAEPTRWETVLRYFIRLLTVQQENAKQAKALVLKSPTHGFRLPLLPSMFPLARYVVIERNPYEVFASNLKLWPTLLDMYSVESISAEEVESFILKAYVLHEEAIAEGFRLVDAKRTARVRYEELVADPVGQMARLYSDLELEDFEAVRSPLERYLASVAGHTRNRLRLTAAQKERVNAAWDEIIRSKGYRWPDDRVTLGQPD